MTEPQRDSHPDPGAAGRADGPDGEDEAPIVIPPDLFAAGAPIVPGLPVVPPDQNVSHPVGGGGGPPAPGAARPADFAGFDAGGEATDADPGVLPLAASSEAVEDSYRSAYVPEAPGPDDEARMRDAAESAAAAGPRARPRGTSRLGLLSLLLGVAACVLCRRAMFPRNLPLDPVVPTGAGGVFLAALALAAILFGSRTRIGVPMLGLLVSLTALGISAYQANVRDLRTGRAWAGGQAARVGAQVRKYLPKQAEEPAGPAAVKPPTPPAGPPSSPPTAGSTAGPVPGRTAGGTPGPAPAGDGVGAGTIFDMTPGAGSPGAAGPTPPAVPARPPDSPPPSLPLRPAGPGAGAGAPGTVGGGAVAPRPPGPAALNPGVQSARRGVQVAQGKLQAVEDSFRLAYARSNPPEYQAAQKEVAAADLLVTDARRRSDGFGAPLIEATNRRKEAQEKVSRLVNEAMAHDPAVLAARRDLLAAEDAVRAAYEAAQRGR